MDYNHNMIIFIWGGTTMERTLVCDCEESLRKAMMASDIEILDELLSDDLIFVNHFGHLVTKEVDIEAHRTGLLNFTDVTFLEQKVILLEDSAVTITRVSLKGTYGVEPIEDEMCYTRVWQMINDECKVITGHCCTVIS